MKRLSTIDKAGDKASDKDRSRRRLKLKRDVLGPIEGTKLYWFIVRCCASDTAKRCMLYV